jgi:hypothetical protein
MTPDEQERLLHEIEKDLDRLTALYNQYFMGIEKIEPTVPRKALDRKIVLLRREQIRNTAIRFRFQTQIQKYNTQGNYWRRVCRQIEEGTYQRHVMLAKKRVAKRQSEAPPVQEDAPAPVVYNIADESLEIDISFADEPLSAGDSGNSIGALDDPFSESVAAGTKPPTKTAETKTAQRVPSAIPQKKSPPVARQTPVPTPPAARPKSPTESAAAGETKRPRTPVSQDGASDELRSFFSRPSVPPPPAAPSRDRAKSAPPPEPAQTTAAAPKAVAVKKASAKRDVAKQSAERQSARGTIKGPDEKRIQKIYRTYVAARKKCKEPTGNLSLAKVAKSLEKKAVNSKGNVDFKVVIRKGKAVIKTVKK